MKLLEYFAIFSCPPVCVIFIIFIVHCLMACCGKLDRIERWVATNAFSDIFKEEKKTIFKEDKKTCCLTERTHLKWLFKDIDLSKDKRLLLKLQARFLILCNIMVSSVLITFWQFLVWEASYDCDEDDPTKDCFERKLSGKQDPLNCSSAAVQDLIQNETIQVICNRIVFNIGLATTVSYSSLKLLIIAVKVVTDAVLVIKKTNIWILDTVRGFFTILFPVTIILFACILKFIPSAEIYFLDHWDTLLQIIALELIAIIFFWTIPWRDVIDAKPEGENEEVIVMGTCSQAFVQTQPPLE